MIVKYNITKLGNIISLKTYTIEHLDVNLGNYATKYDLDLKFTLRPGISTGAYNVDITVVGSYTGITDFIYDVENDTYLSFRIEDFAILPSGATTSTGAEETSTPQTEIQPTNEGTENTAGTENPAGANTNETPTPTAAPTPSETTTSGGDTSNLQATFSVSEVGIKFN